MYFGVVFILQVILVYVPIMFILSVQEGLQSFRDKLLRIRGIIAVSIVYILTETFHQIRIYL